jgi:hypothetical protein
MSALSAWTSSFDKLRMRSIFASPERLKNLILSLSKDEVFASTPRPWSEQLNPAISPKIVLPEPRTNEAPSNKPAI